MDTTLHLWTIQSHQLRQHACVRGVGENWSTVEKVQLSTYNHKGRLQNSKAGVLTVNSQRCYCETLFNNFLRLLITLQQMTFFFQGSDNFLGGGGGGKKMDISPSHPVYKALCSIACTSEGNSSQSQQLTCEVNCNLEWAAKYKWSNFEHQCRRCAKRGNVCSVGGQSVCLTADCWRDDPKNNKLVECSLEQAERAIWAILYRVGHFKIQIFFVSPNADCT